VPRFPRSDYLGEASISPYYVSFQLSRYADQFTAFIARYTHSGYNTPGITSLTWHLYMIELPGGFRSEYGMQGKVAPLYALLDSIKILSAHIAVASNGAVNESIDKLQ
jgi:hypothetical protein